MISVSLHCLALVVVLYHRADLIVVQPSSVAQGEGTKSYRLVYLSPAGADDAEPAARRQVFLAAPVRRAARKRGAETARVNKVLEGEVADRSQRAGLPFGSRLDGPIDGHDLRPGFPVVFPDPITKSEVPANVRGDVVVEVTIDALGNVIDTKLLQGVGHGIDEKVVATLQKWHYQPAMMDGRPIGSKHDVRFHFPA